MSFVEVTLQVERTVYFTIYQRLLANGYIANKLTYANDVDGYDAAMVAIAADKGFAVEIYGVSTAGDTDVKKSPRIVIGSQGYLNGDVGLGRTARYEDDPDNPGKKIRVTDQVRTSDYSITVTMVSSSSAQSRLMEALVHEAMGQLKYLPNYYDNTEHFHVQRTAPSLEQVTQFGLKEHTYMYIVKDLKEETPVTSANDLSDITEIDVEDGENTTIYNNT